MPPEIRSALAALGRQSKGIDTGESESRSPSSRKRPENTKITNQKVEIYFGQDRHLRNKPHCDAVPSAPKPTPRTVVLLRPGLSAPRPSPTSYLSRSRLVVISSFLPHTRRDACILGYSIIPRASLPRQKGGKVPFSHSSCPLLSILLRIHSVATQGDVGQGPISTSSTADFHNHNNHNSKKTTTHLTANIPRVQLIRQGWPGILQPAQYFT